MRGRTNAADIGQMDDARPAAPVFSAIEETVGRCGGGANLDLFLDHHFLSKNHS